MRVSDAQRRLLRRMAETGEPVRITETACVVGGAAVAATIAARCWAMGLITDPPTVDAEEYVCHLTDKGRAVAAEGE